MSFYTNSYFDSDVLSTTNPVILKAPIKSRFQYALLNLAMLHFQFGHVQAALQVSMRVVWYFEKGDVVH